MHHNALNQYAHLEKTADEEYQNEIVSNSSEIFTSAPCILSNKYMAEAESKSYFRIVIIIWRIWGNTLYKFAWNRMTWHHCQGEDILRFITTSFTKANSNQLTYLGSGVIEGI